MLVGFFDIRTQKARLYSIVTRAPVCLFVVFFFFLDHCRGNHDQNRQYNITMSKLPPRGAKFHVWPLFRFPLRVFDHKIPSFFSNHFISDSSIQHRHRHDPRRRISPLLLLHLPFSLLQTLPPSLSFHRQSLLFTSRRQYIPLVQLRLRFRYYFPLPPLLSSFNFRLSLSFLLGLRWIQEDRVTLFTSDGLVQIGGSILPKIVPSDVRYAIITSQ